MLATWFGVATAVVLTAVGLAAARAQRDDPLPSWNDTRVKSAILGFVSSVTRPGEATYVRPEDRIAVFDNDGTLWVEQPIYAQAVFALDRVRALAPQHPEWKSRQPFKAILENDQEALRSLTEHQVAELIAATHSGITTDAFARAAKDWLSTARHPRLGRLYREAVYLPMLELLTYLRANGFTTYIVSGGGSDFLRVFAEEVYGVPPAQVIGSSGKTRFEVSQGRASLIKLPELSSLDDKEGKPINIHLHIGKRPILAFGNSDGDLQMLQYTHGQGGPRLALLLHHDDAEREYAYDRQSKVGRLDEALDAAKQNGWEVVRMKSDWRTVFAPKK